MRITIVQTEIEEAIRDKIRSQIQLKEGVEIDIILRATRGAEGYQADIDIRSRGSAAQAEPTPEPAPEPTPAPAAEKPLKIEETVTKARGSRGSKSPAPKVEANDDVLPDPAPEPEAEPEAEPADEPTIVQTAVEHEEGNSTEVEVEATPKVTSLFNNKKPDAEAPAETPAAETKSIFGTLKRPVNA